MSAIPAPTPPATPGETPDFAAARPAPLDLPRLLMQRALVVALGCLALALGLGLTQAHDDTRDEIEGALALARISQRLTTLHALDDAAALAALQSAGVLRHLRLHVTDAAGRALLPETGVTMPGWPLRALMALDWKPTAPRAPQTVSWQVDRPRGRHWTVSLTASPDSEQREALANLLGLFALLAGCCALMLAVMHWNMRRAFRPLQPMLQAIAQVERQNLQPVRALPSMPIRELDAIAMALKHLAVALERAEAGRRLLSHKLLTLQEDERQRLARDLHDEFGQRLTALRVDAAWLVRRLAGTPELGRVAAGMGEQCAHIQLDVRTLLARLRPLGPVDDGGHGDGKGNDNTGGAERPARLQALLDALIAGWSAQAALASNRPRYELAPFAADQGDAAPLLPRELVLAVYRITQEALTNVARHARASRVVVAVRLEPGVLHWSVGDDGIGIQDAVAAFQQGNGLAGIQERVWALGGEFACSAGHGRAPGEGEDRGWRLQARIAFTPAPRL